MLPGTFVRREACAYVNGLLGTQALEVICGVLECSEEERVQAGLLSRWEMVQPDMKHAAETGNGSISDAFAAFLGGQ